MLVFTTRNAVIVALVQVAIVVLGALASGLSHKWWASLDVPLPKTTLFLVNYGVVLLALPLLWIGTVLALRLSTLLSDEIKGLAFLTGFVLILALLALIAHAVIAPWVHHHFEGFERVPEDAAWPVSIQT